MCTQSGSVRSGLEGRLTASQWITLLDLSQCPNKSTRSSVHASSVRVLQLSPVNSFNNIQYLIQVNVCLTSNSFKFRLMNRVLIKSLPGVAV